MISKKHRFHGRASIARAYRNGATRRTVDLSLKFSDNHRQNYRTAVVVAKKVNKSAVIRNRIRRRIYSQTEELLANEPTPKDLIFTVFNDSLAEMSSEKLRSQITRLLRDADILPQKTQQVTSKRRDIIESKEK